MSLNPAYRHDLLPIHVNETFGLLGLLAILLYSSSLHRLFIFSLNCICQMILCLHFQHTMCMSVCVCVFLNEFIMPIYIKLNHLSFELNYMVFRL